jgi:hypothetical protein
MNTINAPIVDELSAFAHEEFRRPVIRFMPEANSRSPRKRLLSVYFVRQPKKKSP